jgi:hypothetical protein
VLKCVFSLAFNITCLSSFLLPFQNTLLSAIIRPLPEPLQLFTRLQFTGFASPVGDVAVTNTMTSRTWQHDWKLSYFLTCIQYNLADIAIVNLSKLQKCV